MERLWLRARSACPPLFLVPVCGVGVRAGVWVSAAPRLSLGGCWGVRVLVRPSRVVSFTSWLGLLCAGKCLCARPACSPPFHGWGAVCGRACWARVSAVPRPFLVGLSACVFCASFFGRVLVWLGGVGCWLSLSRAVWSLSPHPLSFGLDCWLFFFVFQRGVCLHVSVSLFLVGRCSWLGVAGSGWVVPQCLFGGPVLDAFLVGGWAASCGVGGRFGGCGLFPRPSPLPPLFFFLARGLPVPPSAFPELGHALARVQCGLPGCCWRSRSAWAQGWYRTPFMNVYCPRTRTVLY